MLTNIRVVTSLAALLLAFAGVNAQATDRKYTYACEVMTQAGVSGLVIQADSMEDAQAAALRAEALTIGGERSPAMSLVQCIETPQGRFSDSQFQRFYEELPR